jgi:hypothetical protein
MLENKVRNQGDFMIMEDSIKAKKIKENSEAIETPEEEKALYCLCCFRGFYKHPCLLCTCITMLIISLSIATVIAMALMAIFLMAYGNKEEEICSPINTKVNKRILKNGEESLPSEKKLQIVSDNGTHISVIMA